ncbi:MAG: DUF1003 domain-containing protein [DPANN group archaeon]|nr:DUF1003 domain-containing protein [DPANN group archaeon]
MFKKEETKKVKNSLLITHPNALPTTRGQRAADKLTKIAGSWGFIIGFLIFLVLWMMTNVIWLEHQSWDPYPFILLNLVLSSLAAFQAPIILMSQNRENERDRQRAEYDYAVNRKAEREIEEIKKSVERIERKTK